MNSSATTHHACYLMSNDQYLYSFVDIRTFEVLLRAHEIKEGRVLSGGEDEAGSIDSSLPCKRKHYPSNETTNGKEKGASIKVITKPSSEGRGHTGYLTFVRLNCW